MGATSLVWYRDDLRIRDHGPLQLASAAGGGRTVALYVLEDAAALGVRALGGASRWWLHHSLIAHRRELSRLGVELIVRAGDPREVVPQVAREVGAGLVLWQRRYHAPLTEADKQVSDVLTQSASGECEVRTTAGYLLTEPGEVVSGEGKGYRVYTPFARRARELLERSQLAQRVVDPAEQGWLRTAAHQDARQDVAPEPAEGAGADLGAHADLCTGRDLGVGADPDADADIHALGLLDTQRDWAAEFPQHWTPGEAGAQQRLDAFLDRLAERGDYASHRDFPAVDATSGLSPHLRFGEISPARVWLAAQSLPGSHAARSAETFQRELLWREFAWHRLAAHPDLATVNVRRQFDRFPWAWAAGPVPGDPMVVPDAPHAQALRQWQRGETGIPLVDAGMRELWRTGTMHNRVRMVAGSWLTKNLGIHWRHGEEWFWDTLVDADPASNPFNWQWVAGSGDDASPYFRIFNPLTQAEKFDPDGIYLDRWVPERSSLEYPLPQVDVKESRREALAAYDVVKAEA